VPPSLELKLVSLPDLGYSASSNPPQGEILLRGAPVAKEYFKNPEETEKAYTSDGWFRTGDIGEIDSVGHVKVIDRVKNLVKLQGGEYIALEKLEAIYRGSAFVNNLMIHGDSSQPRPIAVITPNEKPLAELAQSLDVEQQDMHHNKKVRDAIHKDLVAVGKRAGLSGIEMISGVVIVEEEWTPANVSCAPPSTVISSNTNSLPGPCYSDAKGEQTSAQRSLQDTDTEMHKSIVTIVTQLQRSGEGVLGDRAYCHVDFDRKVLSLA
jgi:long-subunit acyl-CoA synthetase (AMP-forming)